MKTCSFVKLILCLCMADLICCASPSIAPSRAPSRAPSLNPSISPTAPSFSPSRMPTTPTIAPSRAPTGPSRAPTISPSSAPSRAPSLVPSVAPSTTKSPTRPPTIAPTISPTTIAPTTTKSPTRAPSVGPTTWSPTRAPSNVPSAVPTRAPTVAPSRPTVSPSGAPSFTPSYTPTARPTGPSFAPSTLRPTGPSAAPTLIPTAVPTFTPSLAPTYFINDTQRYEAIDSATYQIYADAWKASHAAWMDIDDTIGACEADDQTTTYPVCVDGLLLNSRLVAGHEQPCPRVQCIERLAHNCSYTPEDTMDYLPPAQKNSTDTDTICTPPATDNHLFAPYFGLDEGVPPEYSPVSAARLKLYGHVYGQSNDQCIVLPDASILAWQLDTEALRPFTLQDQHDLVWPFRQSGKALPTNSTPQTVVRGDRYESLREISCRGQKHSDPRGYYEFMTTVPPSYGPPRHIMFQVQMTGYQNLTTRLYFDRDLRLKQLTNFHGREAAGELENPPWQFGFSDENGYTEKHFVGPVAKDPRVGKLTWIDGDTRLNNPGGPRIGFYTTRFDIVLRPMRRSEDATTMPAVDINGIFSEPAGGMILIQTHGTSFIASEYPHPRSWGTVIGSIQGNTIRGINFNHLATPAASAGAEVDATSFITATTTPIASTMWAAGSSTGVIVINDPFATAPFAENNPQAVSIRWSTGGNAATGNRQGYNSMWSKQINSHSGAMGYRYLKLSITKETGGYDDGTLNINEIEFFAGILSETAFPRASLKMKTGRTPSPQVVTCSSFTDQSSHCYKAFDGDASSDSAWVTKPLGSAKSTLAVPQWITIDFGAGHGILPTALRIVCDAQNAEHPKGCPKTFALLGSVDGMKFDPLYRQDMFDYNNEYADGGKTFYFVFPTSLGRIDGQVCGSCQMGPKFACNLDSFDGTCHSRYCGAEGLCAAFPACAAGEFMEFGYTSHATPMFHCRQCPPGRYGNGTGLITAACSGLCSAGYFCRSGSTSPTSEACGDRSVYCPEGSGVPVLAAAGQETVGHINYDRSAQEGSTQSSQVMCSPGYYCNRGVSMPCPLGRYGNSSGLQIPSCTNQCAAGYYCPAGTVSPIVCPLGHYCPDGAVKIACPAGTYGGSLGLRDRTCSGLCSAGFFCPVGSTSSLQQWCPAGRYGDVAGLKDENCSGLCPAGYYCPGGSTDGKANPCGSSAYFCPTGSPSPVRASRGFYTTGGADSLTRTSQAIAEVGFYSALGERFACPAGTYGSKAGISVFTALGMGYEDTVEVETVLLYNVTSVGTPTQQPSYQPSHSPSAAPTYTHTPTRTPSAAPTITRRPTAPTITPTVGPTIAPTTRAPTGPTLAPSTIKPTASPSTRTPTASPSVRPTSQPSSQPSSQPTTRPSGRPIGAGESKPVVGYLEQPTSTPTHISTTQLLASFAPTLRPTEASEWQMLRLRCSGYCERGHYCPSNSTSAKQIPCPAGRYGATKGIQNVMCTAECPLGHYCPPGAVQPIKCPAGSFGNVTSLTDASCSDRCWQGGCAKSVCQAGYYCPEGSIQPDQVECGGADKYCPAGSSVPTAVSDGFYTIPESNSPFTRISQLICEEGHFCVGGVKRKCPAGVYGSAKGLSSNACTAPCPAGYYCPAGTANATTFRCPAGRYGGTTGLHDSSCSGLCSAGYRCEEASTSPEQLQCAVMYVSSTDRAVISRLPNATKHVYLDDFPAAITSPNNTDIVIATIAEPNSVYCPVGSSIPLTAFPGYYTVGYNRTTRYDQLPCPMGSYCVQGVVHDCPAGRYGRAERLTNANCTGACARGHYCPPGSISSTQYPCPIGRYGAEEGLTSPLCSGPCGNPLDCPEGSVLAIPLTSKV